ncbi:MAG: hypothetical protein MUF43_14810 [Flavobacterium sp.]|nr:hypothetical protein [Flavobacterium sp.]
MKRYFIILLLINCINLCFSQQNVTFRIQSANVNPDFGLYQLDYLNEASYPKFFSKNSKQITFKISVPTFFYTTDISPTTILALPNDTFIIDIGKKIFRIGRKIKSENYTMKSLTDSLGQFNGVDAVDYILPVAKNPIKGTVNKYNLKDNIARDSILYSYYRKRVDFIKNNINIDFVYKNYWLRYFKYDYLLKSISGLILEEQSLESVTTFWECLDTTNLFRDTTLIHIDKYRSLIIHYLNYLSYKKHKANNSITNKLLIADSIEMNQHLKSWIFYTLAAKSVEKNCGLPGRCKICCHVF